MSSQPRPSIQCSTGPFWAYALERAMDSIAEAGFSEIELMITRDPRTQEPELPARLAEERGLKIDSVHGPFLVITKSVWGLDPIRKIERGVDFCQSVGAKTYVVHPPYLWEREFAGWFAEKCQEVCDSSGIRIGVETMYPRWVAGRRLRGHRWLHPKELVAAAPYVVMDTSHLTVSRHDILDAYEILRSKLVHIHLSDNAGDGRDGHLELEQGVLPLGRFLAEVARTQYSGVISLELSVRRYLENPKALVEMLGRSRDFVAAKLSSKQRIDKGLPRDDRSSGGRRA